MNAKAAFPGPCLGDLCLILLDSLWGRREVWICNGERNPHCSCLENRDDREFRNYVVEIPCCWKLPVDALLSRPPCICFSSQRVRLSAALTPEVIVPRTAKGRIARRDPRVDIVVIVQERKKDFGRTRTRTSPPPIFLVSVQYYPTLFGPRVRRCSPLLAVVPTEADSGSYRDEDLKWNQPSMYPRLGYARISTARVAGTMA
jgi:hypothetical protein